MQKQQYQLTTFILKIHISSLLKLISFCFILVLVLYGCSKENENIGKNSPLGVISSDLIKLEDALKIDASEFVSLINKVRGSVGKRGFGSKVIWSRKNENNLGLYISANHVYGLDTWPDRQESFINISENNNGIFLGSQIPKSDGSISLGNELIADFGLYHPEIPSNATNHSIHPAFDFYIGIMDNQRIQDNGLAIYPQKVIMAQALELYDPENRTLDSQTWNKTESMDTILAIGYPQDRLNYPNGAISTGKVLSESEALSAIAILKNLGDEEGNIPYNHQVEFIAKAKALPGMSGGGVFNAKGQLLGIMVRATKVNNQYLIRVIRITYIKQKLTSFYHSLSLSDQQKIRPFINGEL
tara:strand:+ start:2388 stop:3458 length:1071 start_codon:yes stop_codon:yes gene_type:complete